MTDYIFDPVPIIDPASGQPQRNLVGQVYDPSDTSFTTPLAVKDLNNITLPGVLVGDAYISIAFKVADKPVVVWKSGPYIIPMTSYTSLLQAAVDSASDAAGSVLAAEAAQQAAEDALAAVLAGGGGGGGLPAGTTLDLIPDGANRVALNPTEKANVVNLKLVATTGSYNDLAALPPVAIPASQKGAPNGVASLDVSGKVTATQLPANLGQLWIRQLSDNTWALRNSVSSDSAAIVNWITYSSTSPLPQAGNGYFGPNDILWKKV